MASFNIREQEVVNMFGSDPWVRQNVLDHIDSIYSEGVRRVLAALATALDFRRHHPHPTLAPFVEKKPREVHPIFYLDSAFIFREYVCVGIHQDGWVVIFRTAVAAQLQPYQSERYISFIGDWAGLSLPWLATAVKVDRRQGIPIPSDEGVNNYDLYPYFIQIAYAPSAPA